MVWGTKEFTEVAGVLELPLGGVDGPREPRVGGDRDLVLRRGRYDGG